ncbi:MAG: glycosyltransferase, partial [Desulfobacterales bacterium]|nr:glycosyltransferase [Desulfobacterales bacterium]
DEIVNTSVGAMLQSLPTMFTLGLVSTGGNVMVSDVSSSITSINNTDVKTSVDNVVVDSVELKHGEIVSVLEGIGNRNLASVYLNKLKPYLKLAKKSGVSDQVIFLGGRTDIPRFLAISDILLHPARIENTGTVLIEAMASGLSVLATDICGYGVHILKADAGKLIPSPFQQEILNRMLADMLTSDKMAEWQQNGRRYIENNDVFSLPEKAADIIEQAAS